MTAAKRVDPTDPEHRSCPEGRGRFHRLVITGPIHHRVMRCAYCDLAESTLRAAMKKEVEA